MPPTPHQHHTDENTSPALLGRRQDLVVPAATSEASAASDRKPRAHNNAIKNMSASGDRKVEPLIVFDWDDTILTSSWIQVNELLQAGSYDDLPLDVKRDLAQLEQSVVKCLKNARRLGTVIIITNAESGWVELSAARFFVGVLPLLEGVPVISARSLFESQFPGSPLCWKSAAFAYMMHDHFLDRPQWLQKKVVSIGDSNEEKVAMRIASGQHGTMAAKAIKFITGPDPEALSCQLDFVTQHLASVVSSDSDVDIVLDASMIHGSHSLPLHSRGVYDDQRRLRQDQQQQQQQQQHAPTTAASRPPSTLSSSRRAPFDLSRTESGPAASTEPSSRPTTAGSRSGSTSEARGPFSRARSNGGGRSSAATPTTNSFSRRDDAGSPTPLAPSPQHAFLKRRASSSPIAMPSAAGQIHGECRGRAHGHGRSVGAARGVGAQGVEGGGDCVQPFQPPQVEVGGSFASLSPPSSSSSSSSSPRSSAASSRSRAAVPTPTRPEAEPLQSEPPCPLSPAGKSRGCGSGGGDRNLEGDDDAMALSSTSFDRDCCAPAGSGGGGGADGGGGSPHGGGRPCRLDGGGGRPGDAQRSTGAVADGKPQAGPTGSAVAPARAVIVEEGEPAASKVALVAAEEGGSGVARGGSSSGVVDDGMCGVVGMVTAAAAAFNAAPKA